MFDPRIREIIATANPAKGDEAIKHYQDEGYKLNDLQKDFLKRYSFIEYEWEGIRGKTKIVILPDTSEYLGTETMNNIVAHIPEVNSLIPVGDFNLGDFFVLLSDSGSFYIQSDYGFLYYAGETFEELLIKILKKNTAHNNSDFTLVHRFQ